MMAVHRCQPPPAPQGLARMWRCPKCFVRYVWSERMIGGEMVREWGRMFDDAQTTRAQTRARLDRNYRAAVAGTIVVAVLLIVAVAAAVVWVVETVTPP